MIILLVEDNPGIQKMVRRKLVKQGWEVHQAENGKIGVEKARELNPDLILMDMHMPVMNGHEATRELRFGGYKGKIVALTASVTTLEAETALKDGCDTIIPKPIDSNFISKIKSIVDPSSA